MISLGKQYQTQNGKEAYIVRIEGDTVHGFIRSKKGVLSPSTWELDGSCFLDGQNERFMIESNDLIEVKNHEIKGWFNYFPDGMVVFHENRKNADDLCHIGSSHERIACVPFNIKFKKGEGL